jgi:hypothetical protein
MEKLATWTSRAQGMRMDCVRIGGRAARAPGAGSSLLRPISRPFSIAIKFFQPLETFFPIIGKLPKNFSNHWKNRPDFSNHWKKNFQSLENFSDARFLFDREKLSEIVVIV